MAEMLKGAGNASAELELPSRWRGEPPCISFSTDKKRAERLVSSRVFPADLGEKAYDSALPKDHER
jgi:hypothetical protein